MCIRDRWNAQKQVINLQDVCNYRAVKRGKPLSLQGATPESKIPVPMPMSVDSPKSLERIVLENEALKTTQAAIRGANVKYEPYGPYRERVSSVSSVESTPLPLPLSDFSSPQIPSPPGTKSTGKNYTPITPPDRPPYVLNWKRTIPGKNRRTTCL